jgi:opacity protein-like surface antigen
MFGHLSLRPFGFPAIMARSLIVSLLAFGWMGVAQAGWIDVKTGQPVTSRPVLLNDPNDWSKGVRVVKTNIGDPKRAYDDITGRNFALDDCGNWIDVKTGKQVVSRPVLLNDPNDWSKGVRVVKANIGDPKRAYDDKTGRNFALEPCSKTAMLPTPQVGMVIEPHIGIGVGGSSGTSTYDSTGGQAPFNGDWSRGTGQVCGGATLYPGFVVGPARVGLDVSVCSGSNTFGSGDTTLFRIQRHGPGDVDLRSSTNAIIDVFFKGEIPVGPSNNFFFSAGVGPTFRELNLTLTSNQSFFGGGIPSTSDTTWQTGLGLSAGLSTFVCPNCIAGNPLKIGVEGRARFFPSQSISLRSPAFGFTETGSTGSTTDYSGMVTFAVPIAIPGRP